jgi:hypothetical protein
VLLHTQYNERGVQRATVAVHYVVIGGFALADLVNITVKKVYNMPTDLIKLLVMLVYTAFIFFAHLVVDVKV